MRQRFGWSVTLFVVALVLVSAPVIGEERRLDRFIAPTFQSIRLDLDANETEYSGSVRIDLRVEAPARSFFFHAEEMTLDRVELRGENGTIDLSVKQLEGGLAEATPAEALSEGAYTLEIDFAKPFNTHAVGLYRMETDGQGYLFTQFEAVDARKAFPCWDEPIFKIPFELTIRIPEGQEAVTNTPIETESTADGVRTIAFRRTKPLPTYLLAIAAGPLESVPIPGLSVPGRIYTVKGQKHLTGLAAEFAPPILVALEEYFGRPYPYAKLDLIAIPEYWPGAMENPGAVTYSDKLLLVDPEAASVKQRQLLALVTAHEFAHMWFGDLVTMSWWDDLWLNESFADWLGEKIAQQLYPQYEIELSGMQQVQALMAGDARPSTTPVRKPVTKTSDIFEDLGLAYGKGKMVLRMVEWWIGEEAFRRGVKDYINTHEWGNTVAADLFGALSNASGKDLTGMLSSYLDQPGFPMIALDVQPGGVLQLSQKRFLNYGVDAPDIQWTVPIRVKYSDGRQTHIETFLLEGETAEFRVDAAVEWAMPDAGAVGYYRWTAPPGMMIDVALNPIETLDERERVAFLANAKALLNAGEVSGDDYLELLRSFASMPRPEIINAVLSDLSDVEMAFVEDELSKPFAAYVCSMLEPAADQFGLAPLEGEDEAISMLRPRMIAWLGNHGKRDDIRQHCDLLAEKYMTDPTSIDPSLAGVALRISAIDGGREQFDTYKKRFETAQVPADRSRYLAALGSFADSALQQQALDYILSGAVRPNELFTIPGNLSNTAAGRDLVYRWFTDNYTAITSRMPSEFVAFMPYFVSGCSSERLEAARVFFAEPEHNVDGTDRNLAKVADEVTDCVDLREREGERVSTYLREFAAGE